MAANCEANLLLGLYATTSGSVASWMTNFDLFAGQSRLMFFLPTDMKTPGEISCERISEARVDEPAARPWKPSPVAASNFGPRSVAANSSREPA